jgi:hypothetical protein
MIPNQVYITIKKIVKDVNGNNSFTTLKTGVKASIVPTTQNDLVLNPDLPAGKSYMIIIFDDLEIKGGYRVIIENPLNSGYTGNEEFICFNDFNKVKYMANQVIIGYIFKK